MHRTAWSHESRTVFKASQIPPRDIRSANLIVAGSKIPYVQLKLDHLSTP